MQTKNRIDSSKKHRKETKGAKFVCKKENGIRRIKLLHSGYDFDLTTVKPVVNEKEAAVIRRIFDLYLQGVGMQSIVNLLYSEDAGRQ